MRVLTVVGARPQFVKAAVVSREILRAAYSGITEVIVHTGQHFDSGMSEVFFSELGIPAPAYNLGVGGGTNSANTGNMLLALEPVLRKERPDWVLVYGDTDSTLAAALVAAKLHIPIAHVEAGLRSFNRRMPEEINRILTDHASSLLCTPTDGATTRLVKEGIEPHRIVFTGDVMYDAALHFGEAARGDEDILRRYNLRQGEYALATIHRAENVDDRSRLSSILDGIGASDRRTILPIHPRTSKTVAAFGLTLPENVTAIPPVGYLEMTSLLTRAAVVLTDSGGVQKEAYFHKVPCITARQETEWTELVEIGANTLAGHDKETIARLLREPAPFPAGARSLYGDGDAGQRIVAALAAHS